MASCKQQALGTEAACLVFSHLTHRTRTRPYASVHKAALGFQPDIRQSCPQHRTQHTASAEWREDRKEREEAAEEEEDEDYDDDDLDYVSW